MAIVERVLGEERTVIRGVSRRTVESLLSDSISSRLAWDGETLELTRSYDAHADAANVIRWMIEIWAEARSIPYRSKRSRTLLNDTAQAIAEPDESFYIQHEPQVRGKERLDFNVDPPPDLVLEVEITASAVKKLKLYAALGVPEYWRFNGRRLVVNLLEENGKYVAGAQSAQLPDFPVSEAPAWLARYHATDIVTWKSEFRQRACA